MTTDTQARQELMTKYEDQFNPILIDAAHELAALILEVPPVMRSNFSQLVRDRFDRELWYEVEGWQLEDDKRGSNGSTN